jgi:hypothetical protein
MYEIRVCEHIKDNGIRCGSPALRGHALCYFHHRQLTGRAIRKHHPCCDIPILKNARAIRTAATNVMRALHAARLTPVQAKAMFRGLELAEDLLESERKRKRRQ